MPVLESTLLTAADYRRLTPEWPLGPRYQLVGGELLPMSAPNRFHQKISGNLYLIIGKYLEQHPIGEIYASPFDVYLDDHNVFQPDLLYISNERAATVLVREGAKGAPDLVIEILSPSTAALDRRRKLAIYGRLGTNELWLVDPERRIVEVFLPGQDAEQPAAVYGADENSAAVLETPRLPGLRIALEEVFASRFD